MWWWLDVLIHCERIHSIYLIYISAHVLSFSVWKHLSFILSVNVNYIIQCYQLYLLCFILDPSDSTSCELKGPRKTEVLFHFSQTEKCLCLSFLKLTSQILVPKSASVTFSYSFPPAWPLRYFSVAAAAAAKSLQSCPTLWDPIDGSPPCSPIPGSLQARTLEWDAISFSNAWKWKAKVKLLSCVRLLATPWTAAYQAPPSMGFSRQEYWSGLPLPSPTSQLVTPFNKKSRFLTSFCNISSSTKLTRATFRFENSFHHSFPSMNSNICFSEASWKKNDSWHLIN